MSVEFGKMKELEETRAITIGLNRHHGTCFFYQRTTVGKILNWLVYVFYAFCLFCFFKYGLAIGLIVLVMSFIYVFLFQKVAGLYTRTHILANEELFEAAYQAKSITIKYNTTGKIVCYPTDWKENFLN